MIHTYYGASPERSTGGGAFNSWSDISSGLTSNSLFYPPFAMDQTNAQNIAFGLDSIALDSAQGTGGWPTVVALPGISGFVSAIAFVNSTLIYACSTSGQVYRLKNNGSWSATAIHASPLPQNSWIWGVSTLPSDANTIVIVFAGFGIRHVWRGNVATDGLSATWVDISGTGANHVPDIPVNALVIDPDDPATFYIGSDIGVFRTSDGGSNWEQFSDGLPNVAVYDLALHEPTRLLRAATHGRGLWERKLDVPSSPDVDIHIRPHLMATARILPKPSPVTATFDDPLQKVAVGDPLTWQMCADIKIDSPDTETHNYQLPVSVVDYLAFETKLAHTGARPGVTNRVYVQIHNRGVRAAMGVTTKILYSEASTVLPDLPSDFWAAFPGNGDTTNWKPIGAAQTIVAISPTRPEIIEWDWVPPSGLQNLSLLLVVDSASDPLPSASKVLDVAKLVVSEKRVGVKTVHLVEAATSPR